MTLTDHRPLPASRSLPPPATRVALVEDDPLFAAALQTAVEQSGRHQVVAVAPSAELALAWDAGVKPEVLLLDVTLPGLSGPAAVAPLLAARPDLLIIMVTGNTEADSLLEAMTAGAVGYVIKGCPLAEVVAAIDQARAGEAPMSAGIARRLLRLLRPSGRSGAAAALAELTTRELEILQFVADGLADKEIADRLSIAQSTVKNHLANIYHKWGVRSRTEAAVRFVRMAR